MDPKTSRSIPSSKENSKCLQEDVESALNTLIHILVCLHASVYVFVRECCIIYVCVYAGLCDCVCTDQCCQGHSVAFPLPKANTTMAVCQ